MDNSSDLYIAWFAEQIAKITIMKPKAFENTFLSLRLARFSEAVEACFSTFEDALDVAIRLHHLRTPCASWHTDERNITNLALLLYDYMTTKNVPLDDVHQFFDCKFDVSRAFNYVQLDGTDNELIGYAVAFDTFITAERPTRRLVLFAMALPASSSPSRWKYMQRVRSGRILDAVWEHIDTVTINGVSLSTMEKYISDRVLLNSSGQMTIVRRYSDVSLGRSESTANDNRDLDALVRLFEDHHKKPKSCNKKNATKRLKEERRRATLRIQCAWRVHASIVHTMNLRAERQTHRMSRKLHMAARMIQFSWRATTSRRSPDENLAHAIARDEKQSQTNIAENIRTRMRVINSIADKMIYELVQKEIVLPVIERAVTERATTSTFDCLIDELIAEVIEPIHGHHALLALQVRAMKRIETVYLVYRGTTYPFPVTKDSEIYLRRGDPLLVDDMIHRGIGDCL